MNWTNERPTKSGFYWWKRPGFEPNIAVVYYVAQWPYFSLVGENKTYPMSEAYTDAKWAGPLTPPEEQA